MKDVVSTLLSVFVIYAAPALSLGAMIYSPSAHTFTTFVACCACSLTVAEKRGK